MVHINFQKENVMKGKLLTCVMALIGVFMIASVASAEVTIKLAHSSPATADRLEAACQVFKKYVEEKSNGEIKVNTFPASQLGAEREQLEGVQMGSIEMAALSAGPFPTIFEDIMVFDIPYLFSSREVAYEVMDGPVGDTLSKKLLDKTGVRCLAFGENGFRNFTTANNEVHNPSDLSGLKLRVMENPAHMEMVRQLGAIPTPIPFSEVYTALSQGVVDGQENPVSLIESMRFNEVQKYMVVDQHVYNPYLLVINNGFYEGLSDAQKKIVDEGAKEFAVAERKLNAEQTQKGIEKMQKDGLIVTTLTPEEHEAFRAKVQPAVIELIKKTLSPETVDAFMKEVNAVEAKHAK